MIEKIKNNEKLSLGLMIEMTLASPVSKMNNNVLLATLLTSVSTRFSGGLQKELAERVGRAIAECLSAPGSCKENLEKLASELIEEVKEELYEMNDSEEWLQLVDEMIETLRELSKAEAQIAMNRTALATIAQQLGINPLDLSEEKLAKELKRRGIDPAQVISEVKKMKKAIEENEKKAKELRRRLEELERKMKEISG